jgi:hypothetical protein
MADEQVRKKEYLFVSHNQCVAVVKEDIKISGH